jgi:hydroxymethylpyrimidine/phosphomethylpyrimidine kinase
MEIVLSIAGSDPSAGAGIQQDLKTITAQGCYAATVITSLTSQNTQGVRSAMSVPPLVVASQLDAVLDDLNVGCIKIGMLPDMEVAQVVVERLQRHLAEHAIPVVYDPVMISTSGYPLMQPDAVEYIANHLFPLCTLVTPNLPETEYLLRRLGTDRPLDDLAQAGHKLTEHYRTAFLLKGGHADSAVMTDRLFLTDGTTNSFEANKIDSTNLHGTGCALSSAIAAHLALGQTLPAAVQAAKQFLTDAIRRAAHRSIGHGNGPVQ